MQVDFEPIGEIMRMSGPWTAKVSIDGKLLDGQYLLQPAVTNNTQTMLALVKPIEEKSFLIKKLRFAIEVIDTTSEKRYTSHEKFDYLYIELFENSTLTCYHAFHNENPESKFTVQFDNHNFYTL